MRSPEIVLSFNEIIFYFTRAAVGVGVPYGLAEDFAKSSIWLGICGFDPAKNVFPALKSLEEGKSSIKITQNVNINESIFSTLKSKQISALQAGVAICDFISSLSEHSYNEQKFVIKNVDCPLLIGAALGNYNSGSWKVCWNDSKNKIISFYIFQNGDCKTSFLENNLCNKNYPSDVIIEYNKELTIDSEILKNLKTYSKNRKKYLEKGIPIYSNWERLYEYFSRVLVSSNNNSRISGAGAGLIDVD